MEFFGLCMMFLANAMLADARGGRNQLDDDNDLIEHINGRYRNKTGSWRAAKNRFTGTDHAFRKNFLGAVRSVPKVALNISSFPQPFRRRTVLPPSFDVRDKWPQCAATFADIRDQMGCGSCWAHCTASMLSDRICIKSNGLLNKKISTQDQVSCIPAQIGGVEYRGTNTNICNGFDTQRAAWWYTKVGIVTGGEYGQSTVGCMPYTSNDVPGGDTTLHPCPNACTNTGYPLSYLNDKNKGDPANVLLIGHMLDGYVQNGPVTWRSSPDTGYIYPNSIVTLKKTRLTVAQQNKPALTMASGRQK